MCRFIYTERSALYLTFANYFTYIYSTIFLRYYAKKYAANISVEFW